MISDYDVADDENDIIDHSHNHISTIMIALMIKMMTIFGNECYQ